MRHGGRLLLILLHSFGDDDDSLELIIFQSFVSVFDHRYSSKYANMQMGGWTTRGRKMNEY